MTLAEAFELKYPEDYLHNYCPDAIFPTVDCSECESMKTCDACWSREVPTEIMESIPGYDRWKTTPPNDPEPARTCAHCGCELYIGDCLYTIDGGICADCLRDLYEETIREEDML